MLITAIALITVTLTLSAFAVAAGVYLLKVLNNSDHLDYPDDSI